MPLLALALDTVIFSGVVTAEEPTGFIVLQVKVTSHFLFPTATVQLEAVSVPVGICRTVTVAEADAVPPAPVQVIVYVVVEDSLPVEKVPEVSKIDLEPVLVQDLALLDDQERVEDCPEKIVAGLAETVTVGGKTLV